MYLGDADAKESSYIEFGVKTQPNTNATPVWANVVSTTYWAVKIDGMAYGSKNIDFKTQNAVLDTGTSLLGFP